MCVRVCVLQEFGQLKLLQQREKVVYLENLAAEFNLKTQVCFSVLVTNDSG